MKQLTERQKQILKLLEIPAEDAREITRVQKDALYKRWRCTQQPEFYTAYAVIFTDEENMKYYQYYTGLENRKQGPCIFKNQYDFIAAYEIDHDEEDDTVEEILNIINAAQ